MNLFTDKEPQYQEPTKSALPISSLFECYSVSPKTKIVNERQSVIKMFVDRMPDTPARTIAVRTSHLSVQDLYFFYGQCNKANHFGKLFNYLLKKK